jgi:MYXO-CTERM domain-containing protein
VLGCGGIGAFALGLAVVLLLPTSALAAPVLIDDTAFTYGGSWSVFGDTSMSGGSNHYSGDAGAWAEVTFSGGSVTFISTTGNNRGDARILLDGVYQATVDEYSTNVVYQQRLWTKTGLGTGTHTLRVERAGTGGGPYVEVDAIEVSPVPVVSTSASSSWSLAIVGLAGMGAAVFGRRRFAR